MAYLDPRVGLQYAWRRLTSGNEYFVDSTSGSSGNNGKSWDSAKATIAQALALCSAGDVVYVAEGHTESLASAGALTISTAGVRVIGMGIGSRKPTLTMTTATTATVLISGGNNEFSGFRLVNDIDSLVKFIDINADNTIIQDCDFVTSSTKEALSFINIRTTKDNLTIRRCTALQPTDPAGTDGGADTGFLYFVDSENILVEDCVLSGMFETAIFHNRTTAGKNFWVRNCVGQSLLSGAEPFQLVDGCTGGALLGHFNTPAETAATEATLIGTLGNSFFVAPTCTFGNDGAAGGQGGIAATAAS